MKLLSLTLSLFVCSACSNYNLFFNDNLLYQPATLFLDFSVTDRQLENCLVQHVEDNGITSARQLDQVNCSYAGITDLQGLSLFSRIEALSLKGNPLANIEPIFQLANLRILDISDTGLSCADIHRLESLPLEQFISSGNC